MISDWTMYFADINKDTSGHVFNNSLPGSNIQTNASTITIKDNWERELEKQLFQGYSPVLLTFASVCCVIYMMVGVPGNLITIIALFRCKKVRVNLLSSNLKKKRTNC